MGQYSQVCAPFTIMQTVTTIVFLVCLMTIVTAEKAPEHADETVMTSVDGKDGETTLKTEEITSKDAAVDDLDTAPSYHHYVTTMAITTITMDTIITTTMDTIIIIMDTTITTMDMVMDENSHQDPQLIKMFFFLI